MSELSVEQRTYYLPNQFVYQTTSNASNITFTEYSFGKDPETGIVRNIIPGALVPFDNADLDKNGQGEDGPNAFVQNKNPFTSNFDPIIVAETGYNLYLSPVEARIPTSFYNIYNIDGKVGNDIVFVQLKTTATTYFQPLELIQGSYSPNTLGDELLRAMKDMINEGYNELFPVGSPEIIDTDPDFDFTVDYRESSRKFIFTNKLLTEGGPGKIPESVEVRFFFNGEAQPNLGIGIFQPIPGINERICLAPFGFTIPGVMKFPFINDDGDSVSYWRILSEDLIKVPAVLGIMFSQRSIDLRRATNLYVIVDFDTGSATDSDQFGDTSRVLFDISIPYISGADEFMNGTLEFDPQDSAFKTICRIPGSSNINRLSYNIVDSRGASIDMNGVDWSLTIQVSQQPHNNAGTEIQDENMDTFLESIPGFDKANVNNLGTITQQLNPEKLLDFKERMKKLKGKITFDSILNNLQGEKSKPFIYNKDTGKTTDIPDIGVADIGAENIEGFEEKYIKKDKE